MQRELLFEVFADGREYRIYTNGEIEGFPEASYLHNCFPVLLALHLEDLRKTCSQSGTAKIGVNAITPIGDSHLVPP